MVDGLRDLEDCKIVLVPAWHENVALGSSEVDSVSLSDHEPVNFIAHFARYSEKCASMVRVAQSRVNGS